ncbi:MAG: CPBP family intramembrane glutamic endopeptidase [Vulcanimicrobiaceae bacterium]
MPVTFGPKAVSIKTEPFRISPLLIAFACLYTAAEIVKFLRGDALWGTIDLVLGAILAIACVLTWHFTRDARVEPPREKGRALPLQLLVCGFVLIATALDGMFPAWGVVRRAIYAVAALHVSPDIANGLTNFTLYCVPLAFVLLVLGVPLAQLGIGRFRRGSAASAVVWLVLPLGVFAYAILSGKLTVSLMLAVWLSNFLQNGISEEFLWRGLVFGRLRAIMKTEYALFLQAFLFGAWHASADLRGYHGDVINAVADMIASQAMFGLAVGYLRIRTGNIAIGTAFHLLFDSLQIFQ